MTKLKEYKMFINGEWVESESKKTFETLHFLKRSKKPREIGINYVRAPVMVGKCIEDYLEAYSDMVDIFKLSGKQAAQMSEKSLTDFISLVKSSML